jgi:hypothetical protein
LIYKTPPFLVKYVLASAILVAANEALLDMARPRGPLRGAGRDNRLDLPRPARP